MVDLLIATSVAIGIYLAWSIGVNTFGSTIGISFGSMRINYKAAVAFSAIAAVFGIVLLSNRIVDTVAQTVAKVELSGLLAILISIGIIAAVMAYRGIPISTTYAIIGAVLGYNLFQKTAIDIFLMEKILVVLFISPFGALILGGLIYFAIKKIKLEKLKTILSIENFEAKFFVPGFLALLLLSLALGANSIGVTMGILGGKISHSVLIIIGAGGLLIGILSWSSRTAKTVGIEMAELSPVRGFIAMASAGLIMLFFIISGMPVSTSQTLLGATLGVGFARKKMNAKEIAKISVVWLVLLPAMVVIITGVLSAILGLII